MRRAALRPGKPLRRTPMKRRITPIRFRSKKRVKLMREVRGPLVAEILAENPYCLRHIVESYPNGRGYTDVRSTQVHELLSRGRGGSITDRTNCVALCGGCHDWIHLHPTQATMAGWLKHEERPTKVLPRRSE